jgi:hypothetical protein
MGTIEIWTTREGCERQAKFYNETSNSHNLKEFGRWRVVKVAVVDPDKLRRGGVSRRDVNINNHMDDKVDFGSDSNYRIWNTFRKGDVGYVIGCDKNTDEWFLEECGLLRLHE